MSQNSNDQLSVEVGRVLRRSDVSWNVVPPYELFSRELVIDHMRQIYTAVSEVTDDTSYQGADQALEQTNAFVNNAFDVYEGIVDSPQYDWVFAVPARTSKYQGNEYASEITPFLPMVDPRFGVDSDIRRRAVIGLAPSVIETYRGNGFAQQGAIVYTPLYADMQRDYNDKQRSMAVIDGSINSTARLIHQRLGARVMGLGAHLPALTQYGKKITEQGLETTTGHGGTVHLIAETVHAIKTNDQVIGVLGAIGRIGSSTVELLFHEYDDDLNLYDTSESFEKIVIRNNWQDRSLIRSSELDVLRNSDIIVSAITTAIKLDELDPLCQLDLSGKIIIDDSQPGAFTRSEVEERGGRLVWVVGQDISDKKALHREFGYNFGVTAGLYGDGAVWGCEAEAAAILITDSLEFAVKTHVTPEIAVAIGGLCTSIGISVAQPFQSFGQAVDLSYQS
jgi:hypothetical protein